jgi:hypothetical protein
MDDQIKNGALETVNIKEDLSVCQMLFVDDVGIIIPEKEESFEEITRIINVI